MTRPKITTILNKHVIMALLIIQIRLQAIGMTSGMIFILQRPRLIYRPLLKALYMISVIKFMIVL